MLTQKIERLDVTVDKAFQFQTENNFLKMSGMSIVDWETAKKLFFLVARPLGRAKKSCLFINSNSVNCETINIKFFLLV